MNHANQAADPRGRMDFVARCIRGIEWIVAAEIDTRLHPVRTLLGHREIRFSTAAATKSDALRLATADDVFLVVGDADGIGPTRDSLHALATIARRLPWTAARDRLRALRPDAVWNALTVSASALGRRNYSRYEIEDHAGPFATRALGLPYRPTRSPVTPGPELAVRVHLAADRATFALRVWDAPLHRRAYKQRSCAGTLHPPLAAALAMVAGLRPHARVLDPFAGAGTIAIEAKRLQPQARVVAADIDAARIRGAGENAEWAGVALEVACADGARMPWAAAAFDRVVTNVPWDRAVAPGGHLARAPGERDREIARVLGPAGRAVLLVGDGDPLARDAGNGSPLTLLHRSWLSVSGQHPRLCILAAEDAPAAGAVDRSAPWGAALARRLRHAGTAGEIDAEPAGPVPCVRGPPPRRPRERWKRHRSSPQIHLPALDLTHARLETISPKRKSWRLTR